MQESGLVFPDLVTPYREALEQCVRSCLERYEVSAILVTGTIVRGTPDRRSDLDLHVLHRGRFQERRQEWHCGVPCEIFINHPTRVPGYFERDRAARRPTCPHMFATGFVMFDPDGLLTPLYEQAKEILSNPPASPTLLR